MKIFLDTANFDLISKYSPIIDGVTTNPTLMAKELDYSTDYEYAVEHLTKIVKGPVSVEVIGNSSGEMIAEAKKLSEIADNIVIKIPIGIEGLHAIKTLSEVGIKTNATLIFSLNQVLLAAKAGAQYASIFVGRLDDTGQSGISVVKDSVEVIKNYGYKTQILAASIRHPYHVMQAALAGAHVSTIPPNVLEIMCRHPLTDTGIETFKNDWKNRR